MSTEVAVKEESAVATYEGYAGAGFENQSLKDRVIPYLKLLQAGSPEVKKAPKGSTARAGSILHTATGDLYAGDEGVEIVPVYTERWYVEFIPRDSGAGGYVGRHRETDPVVVAAQAEHDRLNRPFGKLYTSYDADGNPNGNELIETVYLYVVVCEGKFPAGWAVLSISSTNLKFYKKWNSGPSDFVLFDAKGGKIDVPLFAHLTRVTTDENHYRKGDSFNFILRPANGSIRASLLPQTDPRFLAGAELYQLVKKGQAKAAVEEQAERPASASDDTPF